MVGKLKLCFCGSLARLQLISAGACLGFYVIVSSFIIVRLVMGCKSVPCEILTNIGDLSKGYISVPYARFIRIQSPCGAGYDIFCLWTLPQSKKCLSYTRLPTTQNRGLAVYEPCHSRIKVMYDWC